MEHYKLNLGLEILVSFFQINQGGKQKKKFTGYRNNMRQAGWYKRADVFKGRNHKEMNF